MARIPETEKKPWVLSLLPIGIIPCAAYADTAMRKEIRIALKHIHTQQWGKHYPKKKRFAIFVGLGMKAPSK
jgi:hypothetical protein